MSPACLGLLSLTLTLSLVPSPHLPLVFIHQAHNVCSNVCLSQSPACSLSDRIHPVVTLASSAWPSWYAIVFFASFSLCWRSRWRFWLLSDISFRWCGRGRDFRRASNQRLALDINCWPPAAQVLQVRWFLRVRHGLRVLLGCGDCLVMERAQVSASATSLTSQYLGQPMRSRLSSSSTILKTRKRCYVYTRKGTRSSEQLPLSSRKCAHISSTSSLSQTSSRSVSAPR